MVPLEYAEENFIKPFKKLIAIVDEGRGYNQEIKYETNQLYSSVSNLREGSIVLYYIISYLESKNWSFLGSKCRFYIKMLFIVIQQKCTNDSQWESNYILLLDKMIEETIDKHVSCDISLIEKKFLARLDTKVIVQWLNKYDLGTNKSRFFSFVEILLYQKDIRSLYYIKEFLKAGMNHEIYVSDTEQYNIVFDIWRSNIWKKYYSNRKSKMDAYVTIGKANIGLAWEFLCFEAIKEIYSADKVIYQKKLSCGTVADIVVLDKKGNIDTIYECKRSTYFLGDTGFASRDNVSTFLPYAKKVKVLLLEYPDYDINLNGVEIITSKQLSAKRKISAQTRERIKSMVKQCRRLKEKRVQAEYIIDYSKEPKNELDEVFSLIDFMRKRNIGRS